MSKHVIIYLPVAGEDRAEWAVADERGELVDAPAVGSLTEAAEAVEGRRATLVLPGDGVLLTEALVPGGSQQRAQLAVPFALEEQVADDVDSLHFALGAKGRDDIYPVAVISRDTMDTVLQQCSDAGLRPGEVVPETLALPSFEGAPGSGSAWTALLDHDDTIVRLHGNRGFTTNPDMAGLMLDGARVGLAEDDIPSLTLFHTDEHAALVVPEPIEVETRHCAHRLGLYASGLATAPRINLLQGQYSPKNNFDKAWKPWRWTAALAACLGAVLLAGKLLDYREMKRHELALDEAIAAEFQLALPGAKMQRPRKQLQDALGDAGGASNDGFIDRMSQIAASLATQKQTSVRSVSFRNGRFDLDVNTDALPTMDALKSELAKRGDLDMSVQSANREDGGVRGRVRIE